MTDTERLDWIAENRVDLLARVAGDWVVMFPGGDCFHAPTPREAVDAAVAFEGERAKRRRAIEAARAKLTGEERALLGIE